MQSNPPPIILQTGKQPSHSIIWLHGLGADGQDFVPVADELSLPAAVRYVFPHAPMRPVTINGGFIMRAWYDITRMAPSSGIQIESDDHQDAAGIRASQVLVESLIAQEEEKGIDRRNIFLAGFSQGGAVALHTALRLHTPVAGVLALSTYLPLANGTPNELSAVTMTTPIFMAHGRHDPVVPYGLGLDSKDRLLGLGYSVDWHEYLMEHAVCEDELRDIRNWLIKQMGDATN